MIEMHFVGASYWGACALMVTVVYPLHVIHSHSANAANSAA
jgi:hypothetical protein